MPGTTPSERLGTALFYGFIILLAYLVFRVFEPFLTPLGWAAVLVVVFYPWHSRLAQRWGRGRAALASTIGVTLILIVPVLLLMTVFVQQAVQAVGSLRDAVASGQLRWLPHIWEWLQPRIPGGERVDLATLARQGAGRVATELATHLGAVLRNAFTFLFDLVVTIFALFYLFRDAGTTMDRVRRALPVEESQRERMIVQARELIFASVISTLIVAGVQGLLGGVAFALVGIRAALFWGVAMAFLSLVPVVGSGIVWVPAVVWFIASGRVARGILLLIICAGVVSLVDNYLRPLLISGRAQLSGLVVFISVLGGIALFGILGAILGPIVVAAAAGLLDVYTRREPKEETGAA